MAGGYKDTRTFFTKGTVAEWEHILTLYKEALRLKAQQKNKKPEELIKLDNWFQEELPKLIHSRKEKHLTHDEIVQTMKWKLARGKWRPRLTDLVRINTPLAVMQVSKKAFRKLPNLASAVRALSSLKGIGPATASAILAAGAPDLAAFMADECLMAIPECQAIDYTVNEYLIYSDQIQVVVERLNTDDNTGSWNPHRVEKALWTFCIINEFNPSLLEGIPSNGNEAVADDSLLKAENGKSDTLGDNSNSADSHENDNKQTESDAKKAVIAEVENPPEVVGEEEEEEELTKVSDDQESSNVSSTTSKDVDEPIVDSKGEEEEEEEVEPASKKAKVDDE